ncbi:TrmH family RNA methyltransferase [Propionibacterium australiense]|uniref:50S ribosomal protein L30e-like n=1 Tax=Propionibacterium australiense TaxID=119981 RepID=A0A383S9A1_9ACTN|nr:RNA methyltransferase [Propionibacterium australiense]RLP06494.1 RNA methyltransferase [Propionibacterium australiense]RLP06562.1 RNA methyltransferase [Propionibacterium australiense]SYZ34383.1 50S ribosomal protein L30e-like [Propionibacterium australiense]VEH92068.1 tRNA (guanosine(18)-2'-O)-methyltransferase [Propionibacterium australiense]
MKDQPNPDVPLISGRALGSARRLRRRKARAETGLFLAEGAQVVREALRCPGVVVRLVVDDPQRHGELIPVAAGVEVVRARPEDLRALCDTVTPQGVVAVCRWPRARLAAVQNPRLVVICAQVRDPGNAGTVVRCADAFGADAVVLTRGSVDVTNPKTVRATVGSLFHLPVVTDVDLGETIEWAHAQNMTVLAADGGGVPLDELDARGELARPTAWLMGNEAWGLPAEHLAAADQVAAVPMWGRAESLNLSTAAAICLYASASAQRRSPEQ